MPRRVGGRALCLLLLLLLLLLPLAAVCRRAHDVAERLGELHFRTPTTGGPVRREHDYELVQLDSIYSEGYLYGGKAPLATGPWNTGPLHYLFRRDGAAAVCRTVPSHCQSFPHANLMIDPRCKQPCDANSTVTADGNIPGG